jgi:hypothetical protein
MSYANLLGTDGKILSSYLPASAPTGVQNPMTSALNGGNQAISNVASLVINSSTVPSGALSLIVGGNIECEELFVDGGDIKCDNQPLVLQGTANSTMGYPNPTVLVGGGSVLQASTGLVVGSTLIPGQTKVAQFGGDIELTGTGELFCTEINTTSSANVNYLTITQGTGAQIKVDSITEDTSNDLALVVPASNKVYTCSGGSGGPYLEVLTVRGRGQAQLEGIGSGVAQVTITVGPSNTGLSPGIQSTDIVLITPSGTAKFPTGIFVANIDATTNSFNVVSTENADFDCEFSWVVLPGV